MLTNFLQETLITIVWHQWMLVHIDYAGISCSYQMWPLIITEICKVLNTSICSWKQQQACTSLLMDTKPSRSRQRLFIAFHLLKLYQPRVEISVKLATR